MTDSAVIFNPIQLIAISGKQYSGKDTVCGLLMEWLPGFVKTPVAQAIKRQFALQAGLSLEQLEAEKASYRTALIALGNWGRAQDPDYWMKQVLGQSGQKMISDLRLMREYQLLREHNALCIRINASEASRASRGKIVAQDDPTECELDGITDWDYCIGNDSTLADLIQQVDRLCKALKF
jgi:phosphomevalonate kinase